ncbi:MAG: hypothetical protein JW810_13710 [Sedimentisphaerales bacterium]|nr:hypothetical protein [Sedimentisphaerales bacterium]
MKAGKTLILAMSAALLGAVSCNDAKHVRPGKESAMTFTGAKNEVKLITLDPGHFHAGLVQKTMYEQVDPTVHVYAPAGPDLEDHLNRIQGFNQRAEDPTHWNEQVYAGEDFLDKMLEEKAGNVVVLSGNNRKKTEYIKACVDAGLNVLADKPMCINKKDFQLLQKAFASAAKHDVLIFDIMTERHEVTSILQKRLAQAPEVFGTLQEGTPEDPAVVKESVHHFFKYVSGKPLKRPPWFADTTQQGEGIVDVTTHLVDLVMWACFPGQIIHYKRDVNLGDCYRWPTMIQLEQFQKVTGLEDFPPYLKAELSAEGILPCYANGEINFVLRGVHAKVKVTWNFQAPEGAGDTHYSIMRGNRADVIIQQGAEQKYRPELYIKPAATADTPAWQAALQQCVQDLQKDYPNIRLAQLDGQTWNLLIPDEYRVGHEAHFGQVTQTFLRCLTEGKLPDWEVPNMIAKYYITTKALEMAKDRSL